MNAITLWCSLWNAADYDERETLFTLGCRVFGAPLMFAAVAALTDVTTDAAAPVDLMTSADLWRAYGGGAFGDAA